MGLSSVIHAQLSSLDSGASGANMAQWDDVLLREWGASQPWLRIRARPDPSKPENADAVAAEVAGLVRLREMGFKPIPFYRWSNASWSQGVREGFGQRVPLDLREAYQRGFAYGQAYGAVVAGFEIENEPDVSFVEENPETFLAFQKAVYLGLKSGSGVVKEEGRRMKDEMRRKKDEGDRETEATRTSQLHASSSLLHAHGSKSLVPSSQKLVPSNRPIRPADRGLYAGHRAHLATSRKRLVSPNSDLRAPISDNQLPLIVMAPLALPPGPYFEQLLANGLLSYTDAFNYHYYGYAEDFTGAYWQFHDAVRELEDRKSEIEDWDTNSELRVSNSVPGPSGSTLHAPRSQLKTLPVLLTEYGYPSLGGVARNTVEGRVRQWAWFKAVGEQIRELRIAGPMAFYLPPYLNPTQLEFGLTAAPVGAEIPNPNPQTPNGRAETETPRASISELPSPNPEFMAGGLTFRSEDFGATKAEPWMRHIGRKFGNNEATPALAWLFEAGKQRYNPRDWTVNVPPPSPVVMDFVAGEGTRQVKRFGGYFATQAVVAGRWSLASSNQQQSTSRNQKQETSNQPLATSLQSFATGRGTVVLYNFSDAIITGRIAVTAGRDLLVNPGALERMQVLTPMGRIEIPIQLRIPAKEFSRHPLSLRFVPEADHLAPLVAPKSDVGGSSTLPVSPEPVERAPSSELRSANFDLRSPSLFSTAFYPDPGPTGMRAKELFDFTAPQKFSRLHAPRSTRPADNAALLSSRPLAVGEPRLQPLADTPWRVTPGVTVTATDDGVWRFRISRFPDEPLRPSMAELSLPDDFEFPDGALLQFSYRLAELGGGATDAGAYFEPYFRTANGNLYQVWPRQLAKPHWRPYTELKENYTMAFYGRTNLPWRFRDNRIVSLIFFFRPTAFPAVYEVKNPRLVRFVGN